MSGSCLGFDSFRIFFVQTFWNFKEKKKTNKVPELVSVDFVDLLLDSFFIFLFFYFLFFSGLLSFHLPIFCNFTA